MLCLHESTRRKSRKFKHMKKNYALSRLSYVAAHHAVTATCVLANTRRFVIRVNVNDVQMWKLYTHRRSNDVSIKS